ncbi:hypothetical protein NL676_002989 [Syzygium grande]|nr:hypothetical protein NL676_002989 [Syzygium grande]
MYADVKTADLLCRLIGYQGKEWKVWARRSFLWRSVYETPSKASWRKAYPWFELGERETLQLHQYALAMDFKAITAKHGPEGMAVASAGVCALMALVLLPSVAALLPSSLLVALALERAIPPIRSDRLGQLRDRNRARHRVNLQTFDGVIDFPVGGNSDPSLRGYRI